MRLPILFAALVLLAAPAALRAEPIPASVIADPPQDKAVPAAMTALSLPTHGVNINAVLYTAAGVGPHPTVLLLHGLPGNEQNLDLAQAMRREGWNVLTLHYRGSWGSPGSFTFAHVLEDAQAALAWLKTPANDAKYRIEPAKIVVIGHSMGGWAAAYAGAHDPALLGVGLISAGDIGGLMGGLPHAQAAKAIDDNIGTSDGMHTLNATPDGLATEVNRNAAAYAMMADAPGLVKHPLLLVTSDDGLAASSDALAKAVGEGASVTEVHLATDHSYSGHRIALEAAVVRWLENLPGAPTGL